MLVSHDFCAAGVCDRVNIRDIEIGRLPDHIFNAYIDVPN